MRERYAKLLKIMNCPRIFKGVLKIEKIGKTDKDLKFVNKWTHIRSKGRVRYIISRGIALGLLFFLVWLVVMVIQISLSEFQKSLYLKQGHLPNLFFIRKCIIWLCCYMVMGIISANGVWKRKEERLHYLS